MFLVGACVELGEPDSFEDNVERVGEEEGSQQQHQQHCDVLRLLPKTEKQ